MKIVILDGQTLNPGDLTWDHFYALGDVDYYENSTEDQVIERIGDAEIVVTNKIVIDEKIMAATQIKYIGVTATGFNIVDTDAAKKRGIVVTNIPSYGTDAVAQHTFALLLELSNHVAVHDKAVKEGLWHRCDDFCFWQKPLTELAGKTIGIIGFGRIGQAVAKIASAFNMKVQIYSRQPHELHVDLNTLFKTSDVISLHCPLTEETKHIINKEALDMMKPNAMIINTSRGPLIDEKALFDALKNHQINAAGIDVLDEEPPVSEHPLIHLENCVVTPHIAWAAKEARKRLMDTAVDNIKGFMNSAIINQVNL